ncbi:3'-5' exonuclease [Clostridium oceanicum]|uniref:Exonuclease domain-containing protein n=1 Tax=Clostridium oceanicum TaxID=1543 RepID=A0ABN1JCD4_9CLOT
MSNCKLCNKKFWLFFREYRNGFCRKCYCQLKNEIDSFTNKWNDYKNTCYGLSSDEKKELLQNIKNNYIELRKYKKSELFKTLDPDILKDINTRLEHIEKFSWSLKNNYIFESNDIFNEFVVIDFETTGLDSTDDKIIEIGALKYKNGKIIDEYSTLVNPEIHIPNKIWNLTFISDEAVKNKPIINECIGKLIDFIDDLPIVGHNIDFDIGFLLANSYYVKRRIGSKYKIDTVKLSRKIFKKLPNHKLPTIKKHLNLDLDSHRASSDCQVCAEIYLRYCKEKENKLNKKIQSKENKIKKSPANNKINSGECFTIVKDMLIKNNKSLEYIRTGYTGNYFDIKAFYSFVRLKLNGRKQYMISNLTKEELENKFKNIVVENTTKSETGKSRILITSSNDLNNYEELIINSFDDAIEGMNYYREHVGCAEENIQNYLA